MTPTTTLQAIHLRVLRTYNSRGSSGKPQRLWISLYSIMLSSADEVLTPLAEGITALEKRGFFDLF